MTEATSKSTNHLFASRGQRTECSEKTIVIPAQAGIQEFGDAHGILDSRLRGNDGVDWADITISAVFIFKKKPPSRAV
jgi:hypothetical protein